MKPFDFDRLLVAVALALLLLTLGAARPGEAAPGNDGFIEGYAAAVLERDFGLVAPSLRVQNGVITLAAADVPQGERERIREALARIRGVARVEISDQPVPPATPPADAVPAPSKREPPRVLTELQTGLLPGGQLFSPLIADPRWPHFAASYQYYLNDRDLKNVGAVSFGETVTLYRDRFRGVWWELGIQAGVFAVFDLDAVSKDLVNADYLVAAVVGARYGSFSAQGRLFHQSSHVGEEFLLRNRVKNRINLSYESVDLKASYDFSDAFRVYAGGGYLFDQEPTNLAPWSAQYGVEFRSPWPDRAAGWRPIAALDVQNREENDWHTDVSLRAGIQIDSVLVTRNLQLLLEYFRGHSPNGQFFRNKLDYIGLGAHVHF